MLRKDWDAVLRRYEKKGVDLSEIGGIAEEKGFDFEDLVAEVVSWYESGEDDEIKEDD